MELINLFAGYSLSEETGIRWRKWYMKTVYDLPRFWTSMSAALTIIITRNYDKIATAGKLIYI